MMNFKKILVAAIVAVIIICTIVSCAFAPKILDFFIKIYDDNVTLKPEKGEMMYIDQYYYPKVLPEGFSQTDSAKFDRVYHVYFERNGKSIIFDKVQKQTM